VAGRARVRAQTEPEIATTSTYYVDVVFAVAISDSVMTPAVRPAAASLPVTILRTSCRPRILSASVRARPS
jgi:hypothetical protein